MTHLLFPAFPVNALLGKVYHYRNSLNLQVGLLKTASGCTSQPSLASRLWLAQLPCFPARSASADLLAEEHRQLALPTQTRSAGSCGTRHPPPPLGPRARPFALAPLLPSEPRRDPPCPLAVISSSTTGKSKPARSPPLPQATHRFTMMRGAASVQLPLRRGQAPS